MTQNHDAGVLKLAEILQIVERNYRIVGDRFAEGKRYGTLCVRGRASTIYPVHAVAFYGEVPPGQQTRSYQIAPDKVQSLLDRPGDLSSYASRDPDNLKYGGGIRLPHFSPIEFLAWSSYPEPVDEAFMLGVARLADISSPVTEEAILRVSGNKLLQPVLEVMR